ncbi:hypothetical protein B9Z19DRAFT_1078748 [Tuber borchii]|uniref:Uncharacterized protein n=1 Tax=Tuber borchii TaxID=42251 RepID=A0A2T6ZYW5_TUBBO|nr:hypothetical protein B9Z19DRAFT_1078748 [Tuber borchii]
MAEFTPKPVYTNLCVCPSDEKFKDWVRQEVRSFGGGSTYMDLDLFNLAEDILAGTAVESNIIAFNAVIAWREKKQDEIKALVDQLVELEIIPESAAHSPIQLLPISKAAYQNRVTMIKLVPELLDKFEIPETEDELQTKFNAPLYWFAIVLAKARHETPFKCDLKKVMGALVDLEIAKVPSQWGKDEWISKMTRDTELQGETLYLGADEITKDLIKRKPYFGWRLPPYDVYEATEEAEPKEAAVVTTRDLDGGDELGELATAGFGDIEDRKIGGQRGAREGAGARGVLRDIGLVIVLFVLFIMVGGVEMPSDFLGGIERVLGRVGYRASSIGEILTLTSSPE